MILKQIKYILLLIVVACSSNLESELKNKSINSVKLALLDPNSFELISYSLDTIFVHTKLMEILSIDSSLIDSYKYTLNQLEDQKNVEGLLKDTYDEYLVELNRVERQIDSLTSVINNTPETIIKYQSFTRYYSSNRFGLRVINEIRVTFSPTGYVLDVTNLDNNEKVYN